MRIGREKRIWRSDDASWYLDFGEEFGWKNCEVLLHGFPGLGP